MATSAPSPAQGARVILSVDVGGAWIVYHANVGPYGAPERVVAGDNDAEGREAAAMAAALDCGRELRRALVALLELQGD